MKDYLKRNINMIIILTSIVLFIILLWYVPSIARYINDKLPEKIDHCNSTPTLTGEYGQPDGGEMLTGPYLDIQTMQIQKLQEENSRLKDAVKSIERKLEVDSLCGELGCGTKVWFMTNYSISSGRVVLYAEDDIKEGEIGSYRIQTEEQYNSQEYIGFDSIIAPSDIYKSKAELLQVIKGM